MKKLISKTMAAAALCMAAGCFNLTLRPQMDVNQGPYFCTKTDRDAIRSSWKNGGPMGTLLPVFVLDWPLEATCDTVLLPYDLIMDGRHGFSVPAAPEPVLFELNY